MFSTVLADELGVEDHRRGAYLLPQPVDSLPLPSDQL